MDGIYQFGISLIQGLQTMGPALDDFMGAVTFLGTIEFYIIFIPALYWSVNQSLGLRILFILILTDVPASSFQTTFARAASLLDWGRQGAGRRAVLWHPLHARQQHPGRLGTDRIYR